MSDFREVATVLAGEKTHTLSAADAANKIDHGGRRLGLDRRQFDYSHHFPERRAGHERRTLPERRIESKINS